MDTEDTNVSEPSPETGARETAGQGRTDSDATWGGAAYTGLEDSLLKAPEDALLDPLDVISAVWLSDAVGTWQWDLRTDKAFWNKRLFEMLGLDPATSDSSGKVFFGLVHPEDRARLETSVTRAIEEATRLEDEFRIVRPDGAVRWFLVRGSTVHDDRGDAAEMLGVNIDITDRKRDESEMHKLNLVLESRLSDAGKAAKRRSSQLKRLAAQVVQAEQSERKRIADLLHDNVQQTLVAAILGAEKAKRQIDNPSVRDTLGKVINAIQEVVAKTRLLSMQLNPPILQNKPLSEALAWLADDKQERYGLSVSYRGDPGIEATDDVRTFLFEAARELLFNTVKHSGVNKASMVLERRENHLYLAISDEGQGSDMRGLRDGSWRGGTGLATLAKRAAVLGGTVEFDSAPKAGFRAMIIVPIQPPGDIP